MVDFRTIFYQLEGMGFYEYFLPFLLVFVILFAILEKTFIFGRIGGKDSNTPKTNINVVVALIISLFVITRTDLVLLMNAYLSKMSFFIVIAIMVMIVIAMFTGQDTAVGMKIAATIAIAAAIWSLTTGVYGDVFPSWFYTSDEIFSLALFGGIFVLIIIMLISSNKSPESKKGPQPKVTWG